MSTGRSWMSDNLFDVQYDLINAVRERLDQGAERQSDHQAHGNDDEVGARMASSKGTVVTAGGQGRAASASVAMLPAVRTPLQRRTSPARSRWSIGAECSYGPHSLRGSIHISSNSLPSGSAP